MEVNISFASGVSSTHLEQTAVFVAGTKEDLTQLCVEKPELIARKFGSSFDIKHFSEGVKALTPKPSDVIELWFKRFTVAVLPSNASRHNAPMQPHALSKLVNSVLPRGAEHENIVLVCPRDYAFALGLAVARTFPLYNEKTTSKASKIDLTVEYIFTGENTSELSNDEISVLHCASASVRLASMIVDMPCNHMHTDAFLDEIRKVGEEVGVTAFICQGDELDKQGFGGIFGVGKAAIHQPALAVLSHRPVGATKSIAWCGKGIVYDTGGLSIKGKLNMPGMKRDCGGAAAILGAFRAAVKSGFTENLHAVFCLAENAVGPNATRPDDVHKMYSGLTVEVNNTDAEGRLVLGDGVAYAKKDLNADVIVDMATLTGAQGIATGRYHAAILTNNEDWESNCVQAGKISGDLVHAVPYTPELHFDEFNSSVADMKNSVKNRDNAQVSCAGLFIGRHIGFDFAGVWLHVDMAAPVYVGERGTGYGVGLLLSLFGKYSTNSLLKHIAPPVQLC